jgi:hypothetical protein
MSTKWKDSCSLPNKKKKDKIWSLTIRSNKLKKSSSQSIKIKSDQLKELEVMSSQET